jgi:hypothetical protein
MIGQFNIAPSEYWRMTPAEVSIIIEANRPTHINGIPEDDYENMLRRRHELEQQGIEVL